MTKQTPDLKATVTRCAGGPARLEDAIAGLSEADLDFALTPGTWTIRQLVHHIVDGDDLWKTCIKAALGNSKGEFSLQWYWDRPQDAWVESWNYAGRAIEPSLALLNANRRHVVQLLERIPDPWDRDILVRWPSGEEARLTVGDVVEMQADHLAGHLDDILAVRKAHDL